MTGTRRPGWYVRRSPLRSRSHLIEAWVLLVTWALAVAAAVVTGVLTARAVEADMKGLRAERHAVRAVLTESAERPATAAEGADGERAWATVRWTDPDGTPRTGMARVEPGSRAGSPATVWLDDQGRLMPAPASADQAEFQGAALGTTAAVGGGMLVLLAGWGIRGRLERRRLEQWDREWAEIGPRWRRTTG